MAFHLFQEALRVDRQAVSALTGLGFTHLRYVINRWTDRYGEHLQKADELIARAIVMTPDNAQAYQYKALLHRAQKRSQEAIAAAERAVSLNRNLAAAYTEIGWNHALLGEPERTGAYVRQGIRLSPRDPFLDYWLLYIGVANCTRDRTLPPSRRSGRRLMPIRAFRVPTDGWQPPTCSSDAKPKPANRWRGGCGRCQE